MMNNTLNKRKPNANNQQKNSTSAERLATCSMIAGITGLICSLFYFPASLISSSNSSTGLICGVLGIVLAFMSRNADVSGIAIALTFFFFYLLLRYYEVLSDPELGPKFNEYINYLQQQLNQQMHLSGGSSWIHF